MNNKIISVADDYTDTPAGRFNTDGSFSGQPFREELLYPALIQYEHVEVNLDKTLGIGSSFLEEAFGGLIREKNLSIDEINQKLNIVSSRTIYKNRIFQYLADAQNKKIKSNDQ